MKLDEERTIEINEEFTIQMSGRVIKKIYELSKTPEDSIIFVINSNGGNIRGLHSIIAAIKASPCDIITVTLGTIAASCAGILFLQGKERIMLEGSELLFHEPSKDLNSTFSYSELLEVCERLKSEYEFFVDEIVRVTNISRKKIVEKINKKYYVVGPKEAQSIGAATKIVKTFKELSEL